MARWRSSLAMLAAFVVVSVTVPAWWCGLVAERIAAGHTGPLLALAETVADRATSGRIEVHTGSPRFDGEWRTGTCVMSTIGLSELARRVPARASELQRGARACLKILDDPATTAFVRDAWGADGGHDLDHPGGHAWLGYHAVALGTYLRAFPDDAELATRGRAIHRALVRRTTGRPVHRVETYPGETYPPDLAMVAAGMAMLQPDDPHVDVFLDQWEAASVDPATGLLRQALSPTDGSVRDGPRGSGTALAAWGVGLVDRERGARLWGAARARLWRGAVGFGALREHPAGGAGHMDIDSGPVVFGLSLSATGFGIGAARAHGDRGAFVRLHRTAWLFGAPSRSGTRRRWVGGGAIGDAILLAMESTTEGVRR